VKSERYNEFFAINDRIVERRKFLKLSQVQLAQLIGSSQSAVANWEKKRQVPTTEYLPSLAGVLQVSLEWLLTGAATPESYADAIVRPIARRLEALTGKAAAPLGTESAVAAGPLALPPLTPIQQAFLATVTSALSSGKVPDALCVKELPRWHGMVEPVAE
jgi:transcriptional regulator with XRE-family HTH domain